MSQTQTDGGLTAVDIYGQHKDLLTAAGAIVFYERYRTHHPKPQSVWRAHAITKIGLHGHLVDHKIEQMPTRVANQLVGLLADRHPAGAMTLTRWGDLTPMMQRRLVESSILPLEFKSVAKMNQRDVETESDILLVLASPYVLRMLS